MMPIKTKAKRPTVAKKPTTTAAPVKEAAKTASLPPIQEDFKVNQPFLVDLIVGLQHHTNIKDTTKNVLTQHADSATIEAAINELGAVLLQNDHIVYPGCGVEGIIKALNELIGAANGGK